MTTKPKKTAKNQQPSEEHKAAQQDQADTKAQSAEIRELLKDTTTRLNAVLVRLRALAATPPPPLRLVHK